jgi:nickel superoxide dismutase
MPVLRAHCQVPCGIYDDPLRFKLMGEHVTTIEKAMKQIIELGKKSPVNYNQIVRWVVNKEKHAEELTQILTYYFLAQRIKAVAPGETKKFGLYQKQLTLIHHIIVLTMKAKQTTNLKLINKLRQGLKAFHDSYTHKH